MTELVGTERPDDAGPARPGPPPVRASPSWWIFVLAWLPILAAYGFMPLRAQNVVYEAVGASVAVAALVAARRTSGRVRLAWLLLAAGRLSSTAGDALYDIIFARTGDVPVPSIADVFYIGWYPLTALALLLLAGASTARRRWDAALDALIIGTGSAIVLWVLLRPALHAEETSLFVQMLTLAYPIADLAVLVLVLRLALGPARRSVALWLLIGSNMLLVGADLAFAVITARGAEYPAGWTDLLWLVSFLAFGAAALHPSMPLVGLPGDEPTWLSRRRVGLLVISGLLPAIVVGAVLIAHELVDVVPFVIGSSALFLLLLARVVGVARTQERTIRRERLLRDAGAELVAAWSTEAAWEIGLKAAAALAPGHEVTRCSPTAARQVDPDTRLALRLRPDDERHDVLLVDGNAGRLSARVQQNLVALASMLALAVEAIEQNEALRLGERRFRSIVYTASDLMFIIEPDSTILWCGESAEAISGYSIQSLIGSRLIDLIHPDDANMVEYFTTALRELGSSARGEARLRMSDGSYRTFDVNGRNLLDDPAVGGLVLTGSDITDLRKLEDELRLLAFHDQLTGLANRALFVNRLRHSLSRADADVAVMFVDLDDFKTVNDSLGREVGDELLRQVGIHIADTLRPQDTAARFSGDEFAVLLDEIDQEYATAVAGRLQERFAQPLTVAGREVFIRACIGVAIADTASTSDTMLRNADIAMHQAKADGKNRVQLFEPRMHVNAVRRLQLHADLRRALDRQEFVLYYQPIVTLATGALAGYEALVRWQHPSNRIVGPADFIPFAEETGLIVPLGRWVLREACAQAVRWQREYLPGLTIAVNLSARQLAEDSIVDDVVDVLRTTGLDPASLTLELTESALAVDIPATIEKMRQLYRVGVRVAIDDFGTGYSSLSYIKLFPIHELKIDRSFVSMPLERPDGPTLVNLVIELAHSLKLSTVAEGVETQEQMEKLTELGCVLGQGYLFSRPRDAATTQRALADGEFRPRAERAPS